MKASRVYILLILVFLVVMAIVEYSLPKKFVWVPTFSQHDHQPFGSAVFDDVISVSLRGEAHSDSLPPYSVTDETLYQLSRDSVNRKSVLVVAEWLTLNEANVEALLMMLDRGNKVMLVGSNFNKTLRDTLGFHYSYSYFNFNSLKKYVKSTQQRDSLYWCENATYEDERIFEFYPHLTRSYFYKVDSAFTTLVRKKEGHVEYNDSMETTKRLDAPYAITRKVGQGEITLVSTPLIFTNYGMLDHDNSIYIFRLMNQLKGLPIVRTEAYSKKRSDVEETPFRYLLSQAPLRWGLYMTLIVILLFMIFTARRQQRAIPVVRRPANKALEFVELIGTLYFQRKDHTDLVQKKFVYFAEALRRNIQVDVEDDENDLELSRRIAKKTGVSEEKVYRLLLNVRPVVRGEMKVNEEEMRKLIEEMNEIMDN